MTDQERLELITEAFTKALIKYKFDDVKTYVTLALRLAVLMDCEIEWKIKYEKSQELMDCWPKEMLQ